MRHRFTITCFIALFTITGQVSWSQQTPAQPLSEHTYNAGEYFEVGIHLKAAAKVAESVTATYHRKNPPTPSESAGPQPRNDFQFSCRGSVAVGQLNFSVNCGTSRKVSGGEYVSDGILVLGRPETGDSIQTPSPTRFPIVTIVANPYEDLNLPDVASATLVLSARQALEDASQKSDEILQELNTHYTGQFKDTKATRIYLSALAERERRVIDNSRISYESASGIAPTAPEPVVFQDFDRRLRRLLTDLGQSPKQLSVRRGPPRFLLASAQAPTAHESITVQPQSGKINKSAADLAGILADAVKGFLGMKNSGMITFEWSLTTDPTGANVYVSRLDEPEMQIAGVTNLTDRKLGYAYWTFRIDWAGCSKYEDVDPFEQSDIKMNLSKVGCKIK
jgi:hypothetical protein